MSDRLPPQDLGAEKAVLGAILVDSKVFIDVVAILSPKDFYARKNGLIYASMCSLYENKSPIDIVTLASELGDRLADVGGASYISQLAKDIPTSRQHEFHARIVKDKANQRKLIEVVRSAGEKVFLPKVELDTIISELVSESTSILTEKAQASQHIKEPTLSVFRDASQKKQKPLGLLSGFIELDELIRGFGSGTFNILAGRPGTGKTAFALKLIRNWLHMGVRVGFLSMEQPARDIVVRMLSEITKINSHKMRALQSLSPLAVEKAIYAAAWLIKRDFYINDRPSMNLVQAIAAIHKMKAEHGVQVVVLDYIQLMSFGRDKEYDAVTAISKGLKGCARDLDIPLIALSQLSREIEKRPDTTPKLSDLKGSGSLEQDGDIIMFASQNKDDFNLIVAKHKNGPVGTVIMDRVKSTYSFGPKMFHKNTGNTI